MIGERLKTLRLHHKYSQQEVSDKVGISRSTYAGYENEYFNPDVVILMNFADLYHVSTDYILFGEYEGYYIPEEFKEIVSGLDPIESNTFWTHLLEYAKYLSNK